MRAAAPAVLDASALLAFLHDEPGADRVAEILVDGATISAVNWAEVLSKLAELDQDPDDVARTLTDRGLLGPALAVHPVDEPLARAIARLRPLTRTAGLSLGDRACLALAANLGTPAVTADRDWSGLEVGIEIIVIR